MHLGARRDLDGEPPRGEAEQHCPQSGTWDPLANLMEGQSCPWV